MDKDLFAQLQERLSAPLESAYALPFSAYHDPRVFAFEQEKIFHQDWVFVCASQQIPEPGDYFALELAGEAIAIVHGQDGQFRALSNICRHRGTPLLDEGFGKVERNIVCPYHAWAYDDAGNLKGVPYAKDIPVDKSKHCLPEFALETWKGLMFVCLSIPSYSLAERLSHLDDYLAVFGPERFKVGYIGEHEHWQTNWKLAVENGIESYHLFKVHQDTLETITPTKQAFYLAGSAEWSLTAGKFVDNRSTLSKWISGELPEALQHYQLVFLPPSFIGILDAESFAWIQVLPSGPETCVVRSGGISEVKGKESAEEAQFSAAFLAEDKAITERVQKGMYSKFTQGGKLVDMERIVVDFRHYLCSRLFGEDMPDFYQAQEVEIFLSK